MTTTAATRSASASAKPESSASASSSASKKQKVVTKPLKLKYNFNMSMMSSTSFMRPIKIAVALVWAYICLANFLPAIVWQAYDARLSSIREYGTIIHEFDPYFNFRATEYLYYNGAKKFFTWFDYQSWYPLGRPVGTTIYPGMQFTAVWIKNFIVGDNMSLNDVCCYIPAWFGASATIITGLLAYECSLPITEPGKLKDTAPFGSILENIPLLNVIYAKIITPLFQFVLLGIEYTCGTDFGLRHKSTMPTSARSKTWKTAELSSPTVEIGLIAAAVMAIVPAHMMRSVGGGYDNESIANTAMTLTFYTWVRSLRGSVEKNSWSTVVWAAICGVAYFYMVAAWGGYVFVINLVGLHAVSLVALGRFGPKLYKAYTTFYIVGTALAVQVPVVGWTPLKSLEQLGPAGAFVGFQLLAIVDYICKKKKLTGKDVWKTRFMVFGAAGIAAIAVALVLDSYGYFGPISSRVRGLFVKHTKTGNPLVDSVAEHQPANSQAYSQYLDDAILFIAPVGFMLVAFRYFTDASSFLLVYAMSTYFFSHKMIRLILLTAPICSVLTGIACGRFVGTLIFNFCGFSPSLLDVFVNAPDEEEEKTKAPTTTSSKKSKKGDGKKSKKADAKMEEQKAAAAKKFVRLSIVKFIAMSAMYVLVRGTAPAIVRFHQKCLAIAEQFSNPTIIMKGSLKNGQQVTVDDYRECYWWLRDNTPEDSRVMAWWDYGYQLTAIANRTTIADGNTWNHEHIALLGRALTSSEKEGHRIARHLADYVLVWSGGGGDDIAKSPHLARIANSVYRHMCPNDPTCSQFGYTKAGPSRMMRESLLYNLVGHKVKPGITADPNRFKHMMMSKYGKCRVYKVMSVSKESKEWVADTKNRKCDAPGSWFCPGQYPPGLSKILSEKRDFSQLEDFNKNEDDTEYQKKYFENLKNPKKIDRRNRIEEDDKSPTGTPKKQPWKPQYKVKKETMDNLNHPDSWADNDETSQMWSLISQNKVKELMEVVGEYPELGHYRSSDGRGPMFWAYEFGHTKIVLVLKKIGVLDTLKDAQGHTAADMSRLNRKEL